MFGRGLKWFAIGVGLLFCSNFSVARAIEKADVEALVKQLVSPNKPPEIDNGEVTSYPDGFDKDAQTRVFAAWKKLYETGLPAVPVLCDHLKDKPFSFTEFDRVDGDAENYSVGQACRFIVAAHLQPYGDGLTYGEGDPRERRHRPSFIDQQKLTDPKVAQAWWEAHKDKPLVDLQIETLEWVIDREAKAGRDYSLEERQHLDDVLKELRSSGTALKPSWPFGK